MFASDCFSELSIPHRLQSEKKALFPSSLSLKLYNDKITFTEYTKRRVRFRRFNEYYKVDLETGELIPYCYIDTFKLNKAFESSLSRTLSLINEISEKNVFTHFITITFNEEYVDRYCPVAVHSVFKKVIKRFKYKYGNFDYLAVAEFHDDRAIHYHCLFRFLERRPRLYFKNYTPKGQKLFYITDKFFKDDIFVTAELLNGDNNISYLTKYITKGNVSPMRRRFSCSRGLNRSKLVRSYSLPNALTSTFFRILRNRCFDVKTSTRNMTSF